MRKTAILLVSILGISTLSNCGISPDKQERELESDELGIDNIEEQGGLSLANQSVIGEVSSIYKARNYSRALVLRANSSVAYIYFCETPTCHPVVGEKLPNAGLIKVGRKIQVTSERALGNRYFLRLSEIESLDWHNYENKFDVNNDGCFTPIDLLQITNELKRSGGRTLPKFKPSSQTPSVDINNDGRFSPIDLLQVINASSTFDKSCGAEPKPDAVIFASSKLFSGTDIGGLAEADQICSDLANAGDPKLKKLSWKAILSDSSVSARTRLGLDGKASRVVRNIRGQQLTTTDQLWSGELMNAVKYTELNQVAYFLTHTGTESDGSISANGHCNNWSSNSVASEIGRTQNKDSRWASVYAVQNFNACSNKMAIYCLGQ